MIARIAHLTDASPAGDEDFAHVRRVAETVLPEARRVAWLHDAVERPWPTVGGLRAAGLCAVELEALRLLRRDTGNESEEDYFAHVARIARAPGVAGRLARHVKAADLADRSLHPRRRASGWVPPYAEALDLLESGGACGELTPIGP